MLRAFRAALAILTILACQSAHAGSSAETEHVRVTIGAEKSAVAPGDSVAIAVSEDIIPDWHTYWQNPGDSGIPPSLTWTLPPDYVAGSIQWPTPQRLAFGPLVNFGYSNHVVLLTGITVPTTAVPGTVVQVETVFNWLVCAEECIPEKGKMQLSIPIAATSVIDAAQKEIFAEARSTMPQPADFGATLSADAKTLTLHVYSEKPADALFFPYRSGLIDNAAPQPLKRVKGGFTLTLPRGSLKILPQSLDGVLEIYASPVSVQSYTLTAPMAAPPAPANPSPAGRRSVGLIGAALLALAGGLVLNLMPCVFPILSLKVLAFAHHAHGPRRNSVASGLAYTAGIMVAFALVATVMLGVRGAGMAAGWGFQLQSPSFVLVLSYLLFAMGLNLSGVFEISGSFMGYGNRLASGEGAAGSFFTGLLAALVATPCSAPFMGTAIGFAMSQPWPIAVAIIECLGIGLALPYLLLCVSPGLSRFLPRPGRWMERFKQLLAFPLYSSAAWLVWVMSFEAVLAGLILIAFSLWLLHVSAATLRRGWRRICIAVAVLAIGTALAGTALPLLKSPKPSSSAAASDFIPQGWESFTTARLAELRQSDTPTFIDMSAAWCLTCILNERVALGPAVEAALKQKGVVLLKGDWTNEDPQITAFLSEFGRTGVPLYVYYPGRNREPVVLPQILTPAVVLDLTSETDPPVTH
jgi:thiol:disulfide interchange protein DsbD